MNKNQRAYNFSAGPAMLPTEVMEQMRDELLNWRQSGMSVMEISHRSAAFGELACDIEQDCRDLLNIPDNYRVLFLHGGGRSQFAMIPMNLLNGANNPAYLKTGLWGKISLKEAQRYCEPNIVADTESANFTTLPDRDSWADFSGAPYFYYVDNETVNGVEFANIPDVGDVPLVSDMSSNLMTRPLDISRYGLIFACAQKNLGISGVTMVIIRDDLLDRTPMVDTPSMFQYKLHADANSMLNTSPTFPWYVTGLVFKWLKQQGGLDAIAERNALKAKKLYDFIDQSDVYHNDIEPQYRSRMNVVFRMNDAEKEKEFITRAAEAGLTNLKGHRTVGGLRASIYNAMPVEGVDALLNFMSDFG